MKLRAVVIAACLVGTATYARAYEYLDSRGYRHWCQLSCERKGIHVPKSDEVKSGEVKSGEVKSGEVKSGEVKSGEVKSGEVKSGEVKSGEVKSGEVKTRAVKIVDENDLAWEPPPGVKWQVLPENPGQANTNLFKPSAVAKQGSRP